MKRLTCFALPTIAFLLLFLFLPTMGFISAAQTGDRIASSSNAQLETEPETEARLDIPNESVEIPQTEYGTASPSNALLAAPPDAPKEITSWEIDQYHAKLIHLLLRGQSSASLSPQLEDMVNFYTEDDWRREEGVRFSIHYETEDFDLTYGEQTGLFFLTASLVLEDDRYCLAPELSTDIMITVFLYDPEQPAYLPPLNLDAYKHDNMEPFIIVTDVRSDLQQVRDMLIKDYPYKRFTIDLEGGYHLEFPNTWDLSSVMAGTPGIYTAYRRPDLPQGVLMEELPVEEFPIAGCSINIQDSSLFTLSSAFSFGNHIVTTWEYPTPEKSLFRAWYRIGDGKWTEDTEEYLMLLRNNYRKDDYGRYSLYLNVWEMKKDLRYQFQLEYDGVYSSIMEVNVMEDGFYIPNEGDRDGGDRDHQSPPDVTPPEGNSSGSGHSQGNSSEPHSSSPKTGAGSDTPEEYGPGYPKQPVPEATDIPNPETAPVAGSAAADDRIAAMSGQAVNRTENGTVIPPSPEPAAARETDTATSTTWSGTRIQTHLKTSPGLPLLFEKNNVRLSIPADSPALVTLSDTDYLRVEIHVPAVDTVNLAITLNDIPLTGLPLTITMPWTEAPTGGLQVRNDTGDWIGSADYISLDSCITFTVDGPGVYTVVSVPEEAATTPDQTQAAPQPAADNPAMEAEIPTEPTSKNALPVTLILTILISSGAITLIHKRKGD